MFQHNAKTLYDRLLLIRQLIQECYEFHAPQISRTKKLKMHPVYRHEYSIDLPRDMLGLQDMIDDAIGTHEDVNGIEGTTKDYKYASTRVDHNKPYIEQE